MKDTWLRCTVTQGQFSDEFAVSGVAYDGEGFSLFACEDDVDVRNAPGEDEMVAGWIKVKVLKEEGDFALVRLPRQTMENGATVTVRRGDLKVLPARQEA